MKIYVATHKSYNNILHDDLYIPIQVGTDISHNKLKEAYVFDNIGDNISSKNRSFCELTAIYWIWKNSLDNIVGLVHYRRYFVSKGIHKRSISNRLSKETIYKLLKNYDIILPNKSLLDADIECDYGKFHNAKDYDEVRNVIMEFFPEYMEAFERVSKKHFMSKYNMMICRKELWDEYCKWVFKILFELERRIDISSYNTQQKRVFGYLSERLLNVWIEKRKIKVAYMPVLNIESNIVNTLKGMLYDIARYLFNMDVYEFQLHRKFRFFKHSQDS